MATRPSLLSALLELAPNSRWADCKEHLERFPFLLKERQRQEELQAELTGLCASGAPAQLELWMDMPANDGKAAANTDNAKANTDAHKSPTFAISSATCRTNAANCREFVAGCDEVGRGPLAGPLTAAAVILSPDAFIPGLRDSKQLSAAEREAMVPWIKAQALNFAIEDISVEELNFPEANINRLSLTAMARALRHLTPTPSFALVDGKYTLPEWDGQQKALIKGDDRVLAIAAASVLAKVHRDALMDEAHERWGQYGFKAHKGYGTAKHLEALRRYGPCPIHRLHYAPVREVCQKTLSSGGNDPYSAKSDF